MEQNNKDDKKPAIPIPTLRDSKSTPQLKIKGLAQGGLSLLERLKQFKKKDLAFILAGLGVLFLAPLAEHFMMAPEGDQGGFKEGFGYRDGAGAFGKGGSPYEGGVNGLAPGGLAGNGSDVITTLNVRDPASLVLGPGATQQPPATSTPAPAVTKPESSGGDWKDALKESARQAASNVAPKAALPMPKVPLSAGGLRGLGAVSGGGGGSFSLPAISAANVPNKANVGSSPNPHAATGFKGAARGGDMGGNVTGLDALKRAAANAAGNFNAPGSASSNLEAAARSQFGDGSAGGGSGEGGGGSDKANGQSGSKDSKNADGQSLAFLKAKQEQEKAIEFEWKKKEAGDLDLMWFKLRDKMLEEAVMTPLKAITGDIAKKISKLGGSSSDKLNCTPAGLSDPEQIRNALIVVNVDDINSCTQAPDKSAQEAGGDTYFAYGTNYTHVWNDRSQCGDNSKGLVCNGGKGDGAGGPQTRPTDVVQQIGAVGPNGAKLNDLCDKLRTMISGAGTPAGAAAAGASGAALNGVAGSLLDAADPIVAADNAMKTGGTDNRCGRSGTGSSVNVGGTPLRNQLGGPSNANGTYTRLTGAFGDLNGVYVRDNQATRKVLGQEPNNSTNPITDDVTKSQLVKSAGEIRSYFNDAPAGWAAPRETNGFASVNTDLAAVKNGFANGDFKAANDTDNKLAAVKGTFDSVAAGPGPAFNLKDINTALTQVKAKADSVATPLLAASNGLSGIDASRSADFKKNFYDPINAANESVKTELGAEIGEYNKQVDALTKGRALLVDTNKMNDNTRTDLLAAGPRAVGGNNRPTLPGFITSLQTDVVGNVAPGTLPKSIPPYAAPTTAGQNQPAARDTPIGHEGGGQITAIANVTGSIKNPYTKFTAATTAGTGADDKDAPYLAVHRDDATTQAAVLQSYNTANTRLTGAPTAADQSAAMTVPPATAPER